jgi:hypothetical protein
MSSEKTVTKEQLLKAIEKLEKNPHDKLGILGDVGVVAVGTGLGALGAGAIATAAGATAIPVLTTVGSWAGITLVAATPIGWVIGTAAAGGAAAYGISRLVKGSGYTEGKTQAILTQLKEQENEIKVKEQASTVEDADKIKFHIALKEPLKLNLISAEDAQELIKAVEEGYMPISEAYQLVEGLIAEISGK